MTTTFRTHDGRTLEQAASDLVQREVLCCMSSMVATLAACWGVDHVNPGMDALHEQAQELAAPVLDYEEAAREAGWAPSKGHTGRWFRKDAKRNVSGPEEACELDGIEPHEWEVYEHWAVSTWLAEKLQAAGERVGTDFAGLNVWARTTTGQAISMDAVIELITREMHAAR
jgi:hypothetical protein